MPCVFFCPFILLDRRGDPKEKGSLARHSAKGKMSAKQSSPQQKVIIFQDIANKEKKTGRLEESVTAPRR
jgi:hypothetical protein